MMIPAVVKVYLSDESSSAVDVPITPNTTALDVVQYCREPGEIACHLAELWRGNEREVSEGMTFVLLFFALIFCVIVHVKPRGFAPIKCTTLVLSSIFT